MYYILCNYLTINYFSSNLLNAVSLQIIYINMIYSLYIRPSCKPLCLTPSGLLNTYIYYLLVAHLLNMQLMHSSKRTYDHFVKQERKERKEPNSKYGKRRVRIKTLTTAKYRRQPQLYNSFKDTEIPHHNTWDGIVPFFYVEKMYWKLGNSSQIYYISSQLYRCSCN